MAIFKVIGLTLILTIGLIGLVILILLFCDLISIIAYKILGNDVRDRFD